MNKTLFEHSNDWTPRLCALALILGANLIPHDLVGCLISGVGWWLLGMFAGMIVAKSALKQRAQT